jgi:LuxR family transcriptional regulator, quorum-sensing system regulator BjaR1
MTHLRNTLTCRSTQWFAMLEVPPQAAGSNITAIGMDPPSRVIINADAAPVSPNKADCLSFLTDVSTIWDERELIVRFESLIGRFGFHSFLMTELPLVPAMGPDDLFIRNNWPPNWWERYIGRRYYLVDPISMASFNETRPFYWSDAARKYATTPAALAVMAEAAEHGMREGLTFAFSDGLRWKSVVSIGKADEGRLSADDVGLLYLASIHFGLALSAYKARNAGDHLSLREREVLLWVACGKTAWEVGQILGVSKNTVDRHLSQIRRKLKAATNAHAVSLAITSGQLRP